MRTKGMDALVVMYFSFGLMSHYKDKRYLENISNCRPCLAISRDRSNAIFVLVLTICIILNIIIPISSLKL